MNGPLPSPLGEMNDMGVISYQRQYEPPILPRHVSMTVETLGTISPSASRLDRLGSSQPSDGEKMRIVITPRFIEKLRKWIGPVADVEPTVDKVGASTRGFSREHFQVLRVEGIVIIQWGGPLRSDPVLRSLTGDSRPFAVHVSLYDDRVGG